MFVCLLDELWMTGSRMGAYICWYLSWANLFFGLRDEKGKYLLRSNPGAYEYFHLKMEPLLV